MRHFSFAEATTQIFLGFNPHFAYSTVSYTFSQGEGNALLPTESPSTYIPTMSPTLSPTLSPTMSPTLSPTSDPTVGPTQSDQSDTPYPTYNP
mmetsp:Transcript_17789/g.28797  ORF Transcript_17789/g.28797 Transcript_17789/m.28797 type:complete len:93 (+) Transcript_17789:1015-1293(+)